MENLSLVTNIDDELIFEQRKLIEKNMGVVHENKFHFDEKNYLNVRLGKGEVKRTMTVRILPVSVKEPCIFTIIKSHVMKVDKEISKSGFKQFICLNDEHVNGGKCPICEKSEEYFKACREASSSDERKSFAKLGYSYQARNMFIVRVIDRGKEADGVKFWKFNSHNDRNGIYDKLMKIYDARMNESLKNTGKPYSIFDLKNGRDININLSYNGNTGRTTIDIIESGFQTPLSENVEEANLWINDPKTWKDVYAIKTYDYLKVIAEGGIPYYSSEAGTYISKSADSSFNMDFGETVKNNPIEVKSLEADDLPF